MDYTICMIAISIIILIGVVVCIIWIDNLIRKSDKLLKKLNTIFGILKSESDLLDSLVSLSCSRNRLDEKFMNMVEKEKHIRPYTKTYSAPKDELTSVGTDSYIKYISNDFIHELVDAGYVTWESMESITDESYITKLTMEVVDKHKED